MATTLACFTMLKAKDVNGKEIDVDTSYEESGLLMWVNSLIMFANRTNPVATRNVVAKSHLPVLSPFDLQLLGSSS